MKYRRVGTIRFVPPSAWRPILGGLACAALCAGQGTLAAAPAPSAANRDGLLAQVVLGPAQQELKRVSANLGAAIKSGKAEALVKALTEAQETINNASALPTDKLDASIKSTKTLYAQAALKLVGQLTASCEKGYRDDGAAARTFLNNVEAGAGEVANKTAIQTYRARLAKCLPILKYQGKYYFKAKTASSSQNYVATVTWTLWQDNLPGGILSYRPSGTINATGTYDQCRGALNTTISPDLGLLTINEITGTGQSVPNTYMFAFGTRNLLKMTCPKGGTYEEPLSGGDICEAKAYADITRLVGSCVDSGTEGRWLFEAVKE